MIKLRSCCAHRFPFTARKMRKVDADSDDDDDDDDGDDDDDDDDIGDDDDPRSPGSLAFTKTTQLSK